MAANSSNATASSHTINMPTNCIGLERIELQIDVTTGGNGFMATAWVRLHIVLWVHYEYSWIYG